jgi:hypothetical protein
MKAVLTKAALNWLAFLLKIRKVLFSIHKHRGLRVLDLPHLLQANAKITP